MKSRRIKFGAFVFAALFSAGICLLGWIIWPTSGTLVSQAGRSDIRGLEHSLFLGADINGYSMYGWDRHIRGETPLTMAVSYADLATVKFLLSRGADPNLRCGGGMPPICYAAIHGRQEIAKALIEAGAAINLPSIDANIKAEKTAIQYARESDYNELADYLKARSDQAEFSNP